jgi:DNA-binding GntR family transcriptional regulator
MGRLDEEGKRALADLVSQMRRAVKREDLSRAFELDFAFHEAVMRASGHHLLYDMWSRMGAQTRFLVSGSGVMDRDLRKTVELHRRIVAAFRKGDMARAEALMGIDPREVERLVARVVPAKGDRDRMPRAARGRRNERKGTAAPRRRRAS